MVFGLLAGLSSCQSQSSNLDAYRLDQSTGVTYMATVELNDLTRRSFGRHLETLENESDPEFVGTAKEMREVLLRNESAKTDLTKHLIDHFEAMREAGEHDMGTGQLRQPDERAKVKTYWFGPEQRAVALAKELDTFIETLNKWASFMPASRQLKMPPMTDVPFLREDKQPPSWVDINFKDVTASMALLHVKQIDLAVQLTYSDVMESQMFQYEMWKEQRIRARAGR
jgi:hypothetical protein